MVFNELGAMDYCLADSNKKKFLNIPNNLQNLLLLQNKSLHLQQFLIATQSGENH